MVFRLFGLLLVELVLAAYHAKVANANSVNSCKPSDEWVCNITTKEMNFMKRNAPVEKIWSPYDYAQKWINEAKVRGLSCGVGESFDRGLLISCDSCHLCHAEHVG